MNLETFTNQDLTSHDPPSHSPTGQDSISSELAESPTDQGSADPGMDEYLENGYDYKVPKRGDIRSGVIIESNDYGLVVDIGFKREGFVPAEDLTRLDEEIRSEIQVGSTVSVFVLRPENREGHPILSIHQARMYQDWIKVEEMMKSGELYEGEIAGCNRGGLIVKFGKIRGFVPASQIVGLPKRLREDQRRQRLESMIGDQIGLKIIEVDRQRRRLIFSQRQALRAWQELQRERVISELAEGEVRHGRVTSITNFGAFVDLGGADGLIHVSELSWSRVENPRQVLKIGDDIDVYVLEVDQERKRIALSLKKLQPDPWTIVDDHYEAGQLIEGRITRVLDFGAFVELDLGIEGLLHTSEMIGTPELAPSEIVHPNEKLLVKIIRIDSQRRRLALSAKQVRKGEWERWVAEQQANREAQEVAADEAVEVEAKAEIKAEEKVTAPEAEAAVGEVAEEKAAALEPEVETEIGEAVEIEAEATAPEAEAAADEVAEEKAAAPELEAEISEAAGEEEEIAPVSDTIASAASDGKDTAEPAEDIASDVTSEIEAAP